MKFYFLALLVVPLAYGIDNNQSQMSDEHQRTCEMLVKTCLGREGLADLQAEEAENEREIYYVDNASETDKTFDEKEAPYRGRKKPVR